MGMRARERAEHFTWEAYRTRLRELLGQILATDSAAMEAPKPPSYTSAAI
jgi:hypothetical protein